MIKALTILHSSSREDFSAASLAHAAIGGQRESIRRWRKVQA